ncbi:hypothetical protein, partial [Vibrio genomosp. F10]|uniref:hypothetical protein n=1 Tax=Vibrio genomosp. F10 TaxID=723171 RepID=UPI001F52893C
MTTSFSTPYFSNWPKIQSEFKPDSGLEAEIASIIKEMTVEEKVGQMIQPELREITAQEMIEYKIGSILKIGRA